MVRNALRAALALLAITACADNPTAPDPNANDAPGMSRADRLPLTRENLYACSVVRYNQRTASYSKATVMLRDSVSRDAMTDVGSGNLGYLTMLQFPRSGGRQLSEAVCVVAEGVHTRLLSYLAGTSGIGQPGGANRMPDISNANCFYDDWQDEIECLGGAVTCRRTFDIVYNSKGARQRAAYSLEAVGLYECDGEWDNCYIDADAPSPQPGMDGGLFFCLEAEEEQEEGNSGGAVTRPPEITEAEWARLNTQEKLLCVTDPFSCKKYADNSRKAIAWIDAMKGDSSDARNDVFDAMRHAYWSWLLSKAMGTLQAKMWTDAHESGNAASASGEKCMDTWNNYYGRTWYSAHPEYSESQAQEYVFTSRNNLKHTATDNCNGFWP